ncbi:MAG: translocation/assembly module TamB domain-containing protein [Marinibacterium sp.]
MTRAALISCLCAALALSPAPVRAQQANEDSGGRLVRFLENTLSGDGRTIQVVGLDGALSSRATIKKLTVSDDDGVWLTLEDAVLDWNRLALVRKRFSVNELTARRIEIARRPVQEPAPARDIAPETKPFALPELPVAIQIGALSVGEIDLGADVMGTAAMLSLDGALTLADGTLDARLDLQRLDRGGDEITLNAAFSNETRQLSVDLIAQEAGGGLIGSALSIPGNPPIRLSLEGSGRLEDFAANLALDTDGERRFGGKIVLAAAVDGTNAPPILFDANLGGDIRALLPDEFHSFFGPDTRIQTNGSRSADGALSIAALQVNADALTLDGALEVSARGVIEQAVLQAAVRDSDGGIVVLPVPGGDTTLQTLRLNALYDAAKSLDWVVEGRLKALSTPQVVLNELTLDANGQVGSKAARNRLTGRVAADLTGLVFADEALQSAVGDAGRLSGDFRLTKSGQLALRDLTFAGAGIDASSDADISGLDSGMRIDAKGTIAAGDIARFSGLAGRALAGAVSADFDGHMVPLSGAFAARVTGTAHDVSIDVSQIDPLLAGRTALVVDAARGEDGVTLRTLTINGEAIAAEAEGVMRSNGTDLQFAASVDDLARSVPELPGPARISGQMTGRAGIYDGQLDLEAPKGIALRADGRFGPGQTRAKLTGGLDDLGVFVSQLPGPARISGTLSERGEAIAGQITLDAEAGVDGSYEPGASTAEFSATLDDLGDFVVQLPGPATLTGDVSETAEGAFAGTVDLSAPKGVQMKARGQYLAGSSGATFDGGLDDLATFLPALPGPAVFTGRLDETAEGYLGAIRLSAADGSRANVDGIFGPNTRSARFDASLADLGAFMPLLRGTADLSGQVADEEGAYRGEVTLGGSAGVTATASGGFAPGGQSDLTYTVALERVERFVPDFPGRISAKGTATGSADTWTFKTDLSGIAGIDAALAGSYAIASGTADITATGQARLDAANRILAPMAVSGPVRFDLRLAGPPALDALAGTISMPGARVAIPQVFGQIDPLAGQITLGNGTAVLALDGRWDDGGSFRVSGPVALSAPFDAGIDVALNNLVVTDDALYRMPVSGKIRASGPLTGNAQIDGVINVGPTELNIAASTGGGGPPIPEITHVGETAAIRNTRKRAGLVVEPGSAPDGGGGPAYGLNLTISAPKQIFVRGRGLDAELGGGLTLTGTTADIIPVGEIKLVRGRLDLVGRRLVLDRGLVVMEGNFDPYFEFEASNTSSAGTATLKFFGTPAAPEVEVTSTPQLPPEEALGLLVFGDQFDNLSPLKIAQLAGSLATLTGATGTGILGGAREGLGVSSLDLTTDEDGNAQVGVGTYLTDNIYTDVSVNTEGRTQLDLNLDVTDKITAKGKVDNEGSSSIGLFFSKDF